MKRESDKKYLVYGKNMFLVLIKKFYDRFYVSNICQVRKYFYKKVWITYTEMMNNRFKNKTNIGKTTGL